MKNINLNNLIKKLIVTMTLVSICNITNAAPVATTSTKLVSVNTEDKALNLEVDANYSEIVGLKDCNILEKRVTVRIDKVTDILDKESKSIDMLIQKLTTIASNTEGSSDATSTDILLAHVSAINDKFDLVSTTSDQYVRELRAIDNSKCQSKASLVKSQILSTKPTYKDLIVADNNLKKYIKVNVKQTLIILKQDTVYGTTTSASNSTTSLSNGVATATPVSVIEIKTEKPDDKSLWGIVKGLFR